MNKYSVTEYIRRYILFAVGLFVSSFGVAMVTKANMGTSPISGIPYILSLGFPFSLGQFTIAFSLILVVLQILILRGSFQKISLLQIPISVFFGFFIDCSMELLKHVHPANYWVSLIFLLFGCMVLGFGVYLEVIADVILLPGEALVKAILTLSKTEFGTTKIVFDTTLVVIGVIVSFVLFGHVQGIREGTFIAALSTGFFAKFFIQRLFPLSRFLLAQDKESFDMNQEC